MFPKTRYVRTADGVHVAYQVVGDGPYDLMYEAGWLSNIDAHWDLPDKGGFLRRLAERARLIVFDRRGSGVSDRPASVDAITLEKGADDTLAVMDAVGSERAVFFGFEDGASVSLLVAAAHPERATGLVLFAPWVRGRWAPDYPWGDTDDELAELDAYSWTDWGTEASAREAIEGIVPESLIDDAWLR
ncbi:MAG TPA: alpha/beta hydrolase, partial [Candidatus Saccharimonadia bacterium]|nr:alpha/beta hydrolase [Candidatus Saccharimonadia bacterium]